MDGQQIKLNDGTIIKDGRAGYAQGFLWLYVSGFNPQEAEETFNNPEKTERIEYDYGEMKDVYEGFTHCEHILTDSDGNCSVCLTKGE